MMPEPLGDSAVVVQIAGAPGTGIADRAALVAAAIVRDPPAGCIDVVPSIDRVTVVYDILRMADLQAFCAELARIVDSVPAAAGAGERVGTVHEIPVCYGGEFGPDLDELCRMHGISRARFVELHTGPVYAVEAIGFVPGFPYLGGLPDELITPRRASPRTAVPAGSVGIGGSQTGIYPFITPGGWNIVGRTGVRLFAADRDPPALLRAGDRLRFVEASAADVTAALARTDAVSCAVDGEAAIEVVLPGLSTTIQDLGRPGHRALGVPSGGAVDAPAMRLANLIVGNPQSAAGLECTLVGPDLRFTCDAVVALAGADFAGLPRWRPLRVAAGSTLSLGQARSGCRGYLAIAGGVTVPPGLGSRSTYRPARLGGVNGLPLAAGDRVPIASVSTDVRGTWSLAPEFAAAPFAPGLLRVIAGPHASDGGAAAWHGSWRVSSRSDRMGIRLEGAPLSGGRADLVSAAVLPGMIQLPPDGQPIILLADAQTIGGYPVVGQVIAADLHRAAQLRPGDTVRWRLVGIDEAHAARRRQEAWLDEVRRSLAGRVVWSE